MKACFAFYLCIILIFVSCAGKSSLLKDGYYTAEVVGFDGDGWKEYVTICVSGGQIIHIEYNAYNLSGFLKSWDMECMRKMNAEHKIYPSACFRHYGRLFLENQGVDGIDVLSGSTNSYSVFIKLAEAVLANARNGNRRTALVHFKGPL